MEVEHSESRVRGSAEIVTVQWSVPPTRRLAKLKRRLATGKAPLKRLQRNLPPARRPQE